MKNATIAIRNVSRNKRRSAMTILAITISTAAIIIFGGFIQAIVYGMQTEMAQGSGHLQVYKRGFFDYGSGNPSLYSIDRYEEVMKLIGEDPSIKDKITVIAPMVKMYGIAGNYAKDASKTFFGIGVVPSLTRKMAKWNDYGMKLYDTDHPSPMKDDNPGGAVIGEGLARMLFLCDELKIKGCPKGLPNGPSTGKPAEKPNRDFSFLPELSETDKSLKGHDGAATGETGPKLDLLAATASGAPNVVSIGVLKAINQGFKELDDNYVEMHLSTAQRLVYGRGSGRATGIIIQLAHTGDLPGVKSRLYELFSDHKLDLEVKDCYQLNPFNVQAISMFDSIFTFISVIMGVIVLFTIVNTMTMSVMERVNEIGTIRALGLRRAGVLRLFLMEGMALGVIGATFGTLLACLVGYAVNSFGLTWVPPGNSEPVYLIVLPFVNPLLIPVTLAAMVAVSALSALVPARRASRMAVVDALRHV
ncbi:MAG: ABC transporter permease [Nitrospirae bacterium]|nr:ABC transporter permease [Nitrospirota bacterium]